MNGWQIFSNVVSPALMFAGVIVTAILTRRSSKKAHQIEERESELAALVAVNAVLDRRNTRLDEKNERLIEQNDQIIRQNTAIRQNLWDHQKWDREVMRELHRAGIEVQPPPPLLPEREDREHERDTHHR